MTIVSLYKPCPEKTLVPSPCGTRLPGLEWIRELFLD